jgi:chemotaxis protein methyltransferase CheR
MHLNLVQDNFPSLETDTNAMDVILCRNVLIYFTPAQARSLVEKLRHALVDEGWLAVSPSECSQALFSSFATQNFPGVILYRKSHPASARPLPEPEVTPEWKPQPTADFAPTEKPPAVPARSPEVVARELANEGRLADARQYAERWIAAAKVDPAAHYLHAMISQELGDRETARRSLQRAIYLAPNLVLAHFALGNLCRNEGQEAEAARHFGNALRLLAECEPGEILPESEGLSAGRLKEIITALAALAPAS